jgi:hypothetical protein
MMMGYYTPIVFLQVFCLYHAYTNRCDQKWYWIIFFFPLGGSLIYLYHTFYSRRNVDNLLEGVRNTFVPNYKIEQLEKELTYSNTVSNRIELADEYSTAGNPEKALNLYNSCLNGIHKDDPKLLQKIIVNSYLCEDYKAAIKYGNIVKDSPEFRKSDERIAYAWSHYYEEEHEIAEQNFKAMDTRFSNYKHRIEYAIFLDKTNRKAAGIAKIEELLHEIDAMDRYEQKLKREIYRELKKVKSQMASVGY